MSNNDLNQRGQFNVLFLCTGNSARSIIAECLLERIGGNRVRAFSAGSFPAGAVNPYALEILKRRNHRTDHLRSKSWDEFAVPGAPVMDFVFTVCDRAAGEVCPVWPGQPMSAHWGFPDPAAVEGPEAVIRAAFADVYHEIATRIEIFASLPFESLDRLALKRRLDEIGASRSPAA
ncbi:MAG: arsenate reductase ArsC [Gammaproteobacteria bacterium]|nr:arsenate reductase ArsC [Gammaproteobacteria bacterium]